MESGNRYGNKRLHTLGVLAMLAATPVSASELFLLNYGAPSMLGQQGNRDATSSRHAVSDDGRYVVFVTASNNLSAADAGGRSDVYLKDTQTGETTRVSRRGDLGEPDRSSFQAAISGDGRWVAYVSDATDIVMTSPQGRHLYLFDRTSGTTQRVTPSPLPTTNSWTANLHDPVLSFDGSRIAFTTDATLASGDDDFRSDAYLWSRDDGTFTHISTDGAGQPLPGVVDPGSTAMSADGLRVSFVTRSITGSVLEGGIFVRDLAQASIDRIANPPWGPAIVRTSLSADARYVAFDVYEALLPADGNTVPDVYVFDRTTRVLELVSVTAGGVAGNGSSLDAVLSGDGRHVVFGSVATNLGGGATGRQVYRRDRVAGTTTRVASAAGEPWSDAPALSGNGARVVLASNDSLVANDDNRRTDVYAVDADGASRISTTVEAPRIAGATTPSKLILDGGGAFLLGDGSVAYASGADNLGSHRRAAIFRFDRATAQTTDIPLDALQPFPSWPVELMLVGASADGTRFLIRREPPYIDTGWGQPPRETPWDVWRIGADAAATRLDDPAAVGDNALTTQAVLSDDGRYALFVSQRSVDGTHVRTARLFLHDADTGVLTRADVNAQNEPADAPVQPRAGLSRNGRYTVFATAANNLVANDADGSMDLFLRDNVSGDIQRLRDPQTGAPLVNQSRGDNQAIVVSDDAQRIAFTDPVGNAPFTRLRMLDRSAGRVFTIFRDDPVVVLRQLTLSADGGVLAFTSLAPLLPEDTDGDDDVYSYRLAENWLRLESVDGDGANGSGRRLWPRLSADGQSLTFQSLTSQDFGSRWRTTPQVTGDSDWLFMQLATDAIFADGFEAPVRRVR